MRPSDLRVLVVDNHTDYVTAMIKLLRAGFDCEAQGCTDPTRAVDTVKAFQPHLLLLDIAMPKADGFAVLEQLKHWGLIPPLVVAVSGYVGEAITARCLRAGFHRNVAKPADLSCLEDLLYEAQKRTETRQPAGADVSAAVSRI
jgi:CheY-like chemotaxis protein